MGLKKRQSLVISLVLTCFIFLQLSYQWHQNDGAAHQSVHVCNDCEKLSFLDNIHTTLTYLLSYPFSTRLTYRFKNVSLNELITHRLIYLRGPPQTLFQI